MAEDKKEASATPFAEQDDSNSSLDHVDLRKEVIDQSRIDPVLAKKMAMINAAIDEVGMTKWQWKLFFLNGFGYAVDSVGFAVLGCKNNVF